MPRRPPALREVTEAAEALSHYDESYLDCRNLGHVWRVLGYFRGATGLVLRHLRCQRCETIRVDKWALNGDRVGSQYHHSEGYLIPDLGAPVNSHDVRVEMIRRAVVFASEAEMLASISNGRGRRHG